MRPFCDCLEGLFVLVGMWRMFHGENSMAWLAGSMVFTAILALLAIRLSRRFGLLDHPQGRKQHGRPTPLCGGLVLWSVLSILSLLGKLDLGLSLWDWLALHAMALVGLLDDRFGFRARTKGVIGLAAAAMLALTHGVALLQLGGTYPLFGMGLPNAVYTTFPLLLLWFWFLPQAINLMDGINGLVIGFSLLVLWFLGAPGILLISLGALLLFNYPRARLFLGDCGALLLGTLLAILTVKARLPQNPNGFFVLFIYPMVDVSLVVFSRWRSRRPLGVGDRGHLHHRMTDLLGGCSWMATPSLLLIAFGLRILLELGYGDDLEMRRLGVSLFICFVVILARRSGSGARLQGTFGPRVNNASMR